MSDIQKHSYIDSNKKLVEILDNIKNLKTQDSILVEKLIIDLEYLYKKYHRKINPRYSDKIILNEISVLFYESGVNLLLKENFNEKIFWNIAKILITDQDFKAVKLRKDKDFSNSSICTSKSITKIKTWFTNNTIEYETLSIFFIIKNDKKDLIKEIRSLT